MLPYGQELPRVISRQRSLGASVLTGVVWDDNAFIAWGTRGLLLPAACSAQCPPRHAPRARREEGSDTQGGQESKQGLASC